MNAWEARSSNWASGAYSIRIMAGVRTVNRALPARTTARGSASGDRSSARAALGPVVGAGGRVCDMQCSVGADAAKVSQQAARRALRVRRLTRGLPSRG